MRRIRFPQNKNKMTHKPRKYWMPTIWPNACFNPAALIQGYSQRVNNVAMVPLRIEAAAATSEAKGR